MATIGGFLTVPRPEVLFKSTTALPEISPILSGNNAIFYVSNESDLH
jgi:hypothetical protein